MGFSIFSSFQMPLKLCVCLSLLFAIIAVVVADYTPEALADQVLNIPGGENLQLNFNQFSGYVQIPGNKGTTADKNLHYWLVESMNQPDTDPIAFWTNGGPGCSGLLGFMTEQGPFRPSADGKLSANPYAWNQRANMVFIEAPCGVGFSYSDDKDNYKTDDAQTAQDNYNLIQQFMVKFPQFLKNDLYITSESYGGHYMPTLAKQIVDSNSAGGNPILNFKGFAVGNPQSTFYSAIPASLETYWGHQLVSKPTWDKYNKDCQTVSTFDFEKCERIFIEMYEEIGNLNPYALDYPVCVDSSSRATVGRGRGQRNWLMRHMIGEGHQELKKSMGLEADSSYQPCEDDYATTYLNRADVQAAIHVKANTAWEECSHSVRYAQTDAWHSMVPIYQYLIENKEKFNLKILVYSGDDDSVCGTVGAQEWIWSFLPRERVSGRAWKTWLVSNQTAGYITKWKDTGFAFATVHGAGHEVPTYKPEVALDLFNNYLDGTITNG